MNKNKQEIIKLAMNQCAIDLNCEVKDFTEEENVIVMPKNLTGRRHFISGEFFFRMITFGGNAVIAANKEIYPWFNQYIKGKPGHCLFEEPNQIDINNELVKYNKPLWSTTHSCLPIMGMPNTTINDNIVVKWFEKDEIPLLYTHEGFQNALQYKIKTNRPDVLVVASFKGNQITGMAGASADSNIFWQIGVDVISSHRGNGLGTYLTVILKDEIIRRGYIPYYSTSQSNIYSQNIAMKAVFFPAWVEAYSTEPKED